MKKLHTIQIQKGDNGFIISSMTDELPSRNKKLIAKDEAEVKSLVTDIVNNDLFAAAPAPSVAEPAQAAS